jgi:hypothetical protein
MTLLTDPRRSVETGAEQEVKKGRRRFIHGIGVAVPVVMTVRSPSALAGGQCLAPSATASIALLHSRPDRQQFYCKGRTPGFWKNAWDTHPLIWSSSGGEGVLFSAVFGSGFPGQTLKQVMNLGGGSVDPWELGAHLSAAYLNYRMGWVPLGVLSVGDLVEMWNGRFGTYEPTAGVRWNGEQIVAYLQTTMTE